MKPRCTGFTMVELLVVMAVVSVVAALTMSALARGRHHRDAAQCISNLRQLAQANLRYAADNGGQFVYAMDRPNRRRWHGERRDVDESFDPTRGPLAPYLSHEGRVKICPAFEGMITDRTSFEVGAGGYGYNAAYIGGSPRNRFEGERVSNVERPSQTLMFADTAMARSHGIQEYPFAEPWEWVTSSGKLGGELTPSVHFRHDRHANVAWCDGHVTAEKPSPIPGHSFYGGDNRKYHIGWFGPYKENGYWNPHRESAE
jgi:prepilin-type N-terminal cleavage/methylation domain-containing protein/prepilin-type processing-associated H-X9-DG protein